MKAIIQSQQVSPMIETFNPMYRFMHPPRYSQDVRLISDDGGVEIDMRIESINGFIFPSNCDLEVEIKITATPKQPSPITKILK